LNTLFSNNRLIKQSKPSFTSNVFAIYSLQPSIKNTTQEMEQAKSTQKSTKKFFNKIFHSNNNSKKSSSSVSPQNSAFDAFDLTPRTIKNRRSNEEVFPSNSQQQSSSSIVRSNSIQRRYSFSNVHESGQRRLLAAKRAEYQEKMQAFDDLISKRRGSTLRMALAPDVTSY